MAMKSIMVKLSPKMHEAVGDAKGQFSFQVTSELGLLLFLHLRGSCETVEKARELVRDERSWALFARLINGEKWPD